MKYYLYISDSKVDMLLPQVRDDVKKKIAYEFKIDLKVLGVARRAEHETPNDRIARLQAVCDYLESEGRIGSADDPLEYFGDTMPMKWGPLRRLRGAVRNLADRTDWNFAYFSGSTGQTLVGLGGSESHLIGSSPPTGRFVPPSGVPGISHYLGELVLEAAGDNFPADAEPSALESAVQVNSSMRGTEQQLEFVAKRLLYGELPQGSGNNIEHVLIGSPLYVALAE